MSSSPRGLRLNNPGNLNKTAPGVKRWDGEIDSPDSRFANFLAIEYGYRAMAKLLYNYVTKFGADTIREITHKYAPADDGNNPASYANFISKNTGIGIDEPLTKEDFRWRPGSEPNALKIMRWIVKVEQGQMPEEVKMGAGYKMFLQGYPDLT